MVYKRTFLLKINALACVKAADTPPMLKNINFSHLYCEESLRRDKMLKFVHKCQMYIII